MKTDNELIAEFMGLPLMKQEPEFVGDRKLKEVPFQRWKYDSSWDWLMPVVEKIDEIHSSKFKYDIKEIALGDWPKDHEYMEVIAIPLATPIAEVYDAVIKFIKWHNEQTKS